jgi:malonyl-CoA O-methyltransferase
MIEKALDWIKKNTIAEQGIVVTSHQRVCYPEVTGYIIPTLLRSGETGLALNYAHWLVNIQHNDGSLGSLIDGKSYVFDTGQIIRGWTSVLERSLDLEIPLRKACNWIMSSADPASARLAVPQENAWSLGDRGRVNEGIHLYVLDAMKFAGEKLNEPDILKFVEKSANFYLKNIEITNFKSKNSLTHFYAYIQEALVNLGFEDIAHEGMRLIEEIQQDNGAIPAYYDVNWVCSTGMAQLALVWLKLGEYNRAEKALKFLEILQNPSGGFWGSYGVGATYFPTEEIPWAAKYYIDAVQEQIVVHFNKTAIEYKTNIDVSDDRMASVLKEIGNANGKRILDAGCGKGRYSILLKKEFPQAEIVAMDVSTEMLSQIPANIIKINRGILDMPFADNYFDFVICIEALEHVVQIETGIKELLRVIKPGGKLIVIDKNKNKLGMLETPTWEKWFGKDELITLMSKYGTISGSADYIGYDNVKSPDGLFICWTGIKSS